MHRRVWLSTLGFVLLFSPAALGQPVDKAAADRLFKEGRAAYDKGDYATACPKFAASQKADPAAGTLLNLAVCEERLGKVASAREHLSELLPQLGQKDDRLPFAMELVGKVDARVARLRVTLAEGAPAETVARLKQGDEQKTLAFGAEIVLDPGTYKLEITAPGRPDSQSELKLAEGQREARAIAPAEAEAVKSKGKEEVVTPPPPPPPSSAPLRRTIGFVAGGVGVASFVVAGITGGIIVNKRSRLDELCGPTHKACSGNWENVREGAKGLLPVNTAMWILGIAGVGAGTVLILTSLGGDKTPPPVTPSAAVLPGGGGVGMSGRF